jgi:predicted dehydrogenase
MRVVAVAEPDDERRNYLADAHDIPYARRFRSWEALLAAPLFGDAALICNPDEQHIGAAIGAMKAGYHVMVDTPIAFSAADCFQMSVVAQQTHQHLMLSHGLRYTAFYRALKDIINSGRLGDIQKYHHDRAHPLWQVAHQFLRTPYWQNTANPILLTEGLHELDLALWLLDDGVLTINAASSTRRFRRQDAPDSNVPHRCVDNCPVEADCPFSAIGIYQERRFRSMPPKGYPYIIPDDSEASTGALRHAIESGPWGNCVFYTERELVDQQSILLGTRSQANVVLNINANSLDDSRIIHIEGSKGKLLAEFIGLESHVTFVDHTSNKENKINFHIGPGAHGGDHGLLGNLVRMLRGDAESLTLAPDAIKAHLLAFAVEEARHTQRAITFQNTPI